MVHGYAHVGSSRHTRLQQSLSSKRIHLWAKFTPIQWPIYWTNHNYAVFLRREGPFWITPPSSPSAQIKHVHDLVSFQRFANKGCCQPLFSSWFINLYRPTPSPHQWISQRCFSNWNQWFVIYTYNLHTYIYYYNPLQDFSWLFWTRQPTCLSHNRNNLLRASPSNHAAQPPPGIAYDLRRRWAGGELLGDRGLNQRRLAGAAFGTNTIVPLGVGCRFLVPSGLNCLAIAASKMISKSAQTSA